MIYTVTFAPSIDYIPYVDDFQANTLNRAKEVSYYPGGKGINISRVLKRMEVDATALGFVGGFTGDYIQQFLQREQVPSAFIQVDSVTRINVKIKSQQETELNGPAPTLQSQEIEQLLYFLQLHAKEDDWIVVSGSIPETVTDEFFEQLQKSCALTGAKWVLDTSGPRLKQLLQYQPYFIKPNQHELGELVGDTIDTLEQAVAHAKKITEQDVSLVIVSLGGEGAVCVSSDTQFLAKAPKGQVVNTVGAGDSLVAGMVAQLAQQQSLQDAFCYGVASGSATAFKEDLCHKEEVEKLVPQVEIQTI